MCMNAIEVENLVRIYKSYNMFGAVKKEHMALNNISFNVNKGEVFGILGPNGAGKTTMIKILTTLLLPTSGNATILGYDVSKDSSIIRDRINFTFGGDRGLYWRISGRDNLRYFSDLYNIPPNIAKKRINNILEIVGLDKWADEKVEKYSKGMKQRLHIGKALINDPDIIFLDEPTLGLDPVGAKDLRNIIYNLIKLDKTILLTTHYMFEAEILCNRIAVINHGKIVALESPEVIKKAAKDNMVLEIEVYGIEKDKLLNLKQLDNVESVTLKTFEQSQVIQIQLKESQMNTNININGIVNLLGDIQIKDIRNRKASLEDAYIKIVGGENE